jgi:Reverse transcriptase (RNA-dependent DNA polymerase)
VHGGLKENSTGMEASMDENLFLKKTIYGLVQSARQFYVKLVEALKGCGFNGSQDDPYLWIKNSSSGIVLFAFCVDDSLTIGTDKAIDDVVESLKAYGFGFKVKNNLTDYLSCKIVQDFDLSKAWIMQPYIT